MRETNSADAAERDAFIELALRDGIGITTLRRYQEKGITYREARNRVSNAAPRQPALAAERELLQRSCRACGADVVTYLDSAYPASLRELEDAPPLLFMKGDVRALHLPLVAMVGTRTLTRYGELVARELARELSDAGACIVSGLARGVDAAAHRGALLGAGRTCAVLGTGTDVVYPVHHSTLQTTIAERGLLITEMRPGQRPSPGSFPMRNRIIAALAPLTIVVEAGEKSGALITANYALNLGRTVAAVPGRIDSMQSAGCNALLRDGAHVIATVDDALSLAGLARAKFRHAERAFSEVERAVLRTLGRRCISLQALVDESGLPVPECMSAISALELEGAIESLLTGELRARPGAIRALQPGPC